jgi:Ca2+/Na+ antiporter
MKLTFFLCLFVLICFFSCASKKEVITDKGTTNEEVTKQEIEQNTTEQTEDYTLTFGEGETFSTDFEVVIFGDSGRYNLHTGEATGVKNVIKNKEEQKKQNTTNYNKSQQTTTNQTNITTADSTRQEQKNIVQETTTKKNNWYIWLIVGSVATIVVIIVLRILLR